MQPLALPSVKTKLQQDPDQSTLNARCRKGVRLFYRGDGFDAVVP